MSRALICSESGERWWVDGVEEGTNRKRLKERRVVNAVFSARKGQMVLIQFTHFEDRSVTTNSGPFCGFTELTRRGVFGCNILASCLALPLHSHVTIGPGRHHAGHLCCTFRGAIILPVVLMNFRTEQKCNNLHLLQVFPDSTSGSMCEGRRSKLWLSCCEH